MLLVLLTLPALSIALPNPPTMVPAAYIAPFDDSVAKALEGAGESVEALATLARDWATSGLEDAAVTAWTRVLELDANHEEAHVGLRHHRWQENWYDTYAALSSAKRAEAKRRLKEDGVVPFGKEWVKPEDLPFRRMGWVREGTEAWAPVGAAERRAQEAAWEAAGWKQQHLTWVAPDEFEPWRAGLWKVGDEWLEAAAADEAHGKIGAWWQIPGEHFVALTTVPEEQARWVTWWADQSHADLIELFGLEAASKPEFVVLNSIAQYNDFSAGNAVEQRNPADASGFSSLHYAYFTDGWIDRTGASPIFRGTGAAYYDVNDPALKPFGQHAVRHAAAFAWLEAIDPSWNAVSLMLTSGAGGFPDATYWGEKRIPRWMRYGAAAYCERFFEDRTVGEGGDPLWARKWALSNLKQGGEMDSVEAILGLSLNTAAPVESLRLIHEAGLLMHYLLHAGDKKVDKAWGAFRSKLIAGESTRPEALALEAALGKAEKKIAKFAGLESR